MKPGQESQTAILVCAGRAYAHGNSSAPGFSDPTARTLLPEEARLRLDRARTHAPARLRERVWRRILGRRAKVMVVRTLAIDDAIRTGKASQLVILGAGLDGRAWRMPELKDVTVFEVDHPDSQRRKRERAQALTPVSKDIRFVPVDFTRDDLDKSLSEADHDPARPTIWIWEGVVMYLEQKDIEATLGVIARRSVSGSRIVIVYHQQALILLALGGLVKRIGEPLRSAFSPEAMRALLAKFGFGVVRDESIAEIGRRLPADITKATRPIGHLRVVTADRV